MKMNKNAVQARIHNLANQKEVSDNIILQNYFFDAFLKRLSKTKYVNNFIIKGGFLLSSSLGIDFRSTMDIDFLLKNITIEKNHIQKIIEEIISVDVDDVIIFQLVSVCDIRLDDEYGGFHISLLGHLENIKVVVNIDIATGDPITPTAITYKYKCLFDEEILPLVSYNFETIIAEKLETILKRGLINSRCKDYYDLYMIYKIKLDELDDYVLKEAYKRTCLYRKLDISQEIAIKILDEIEKDKTMNSRWNLYCNKKNYAQNILFSDVIKIIKEIINIIY